MRPPHTAKRGLSIASVGEHLLIERIRQRVGPPPDYVELGIGDDAAVIVPARGMVDVVTTDALVENVHFRADWTPATSIGHKALAVNLSDLAAMGATPRASLLSLALPDDFPLDDFDALLDGFAALASAARAPLVGGNLTRSPKGVVIDVTALGSVRRRRVLRRHTARAGDELWVTGAIGAAAAGLAILSAGVSRTSLDEQLTACVARYERPEARSRCGSIIGRTGVASAAMDLSDGLAATARAIAEASGVGVTLEAESLPVHDGARAWCARSGEDPVRFSLAGGEDYELAFAVRPRLRSRFLAAAARTSDLKMTRVGRFTAERETCLSRNGSPEALPVGFVHFDADSSPETE